MTIQCLYRVQFSFAFKPEALLLRRHIRISVAAPAPTSQGMAER
jgi:hypothetical protein